MIQVAVYETRPYDREHLLAASAGKPIQWHFNEFRLSEETAMTARGMDAVCAFVNDRLDRACLSILHEQKVRLVAMRCMGYNNVDVQGAYELGVKITRVPGYSPYSVAEHAVGLLMTLNRKVHRAYNRVRELNFSLNGLVGSDLHGKTAGMLGTGRIGKLVAEILRGFGMRVLAYDPFPSHDWAVENQVQYVPLRELLQQSDVVSVHVPLTPETHQLIRKDTLDLMKRGAYLINVSRGKLIDTADVIDALKTGRLGGVALDVYEEEEGIFFEDLSGGMLHDDELARLLTFPNVLITAHQAFLTHEALTDIATVTVENLCRLERGEGFIEGTKL